MILFSAHKMSAELLKGKIISKDKGSTEAVIGASVYIEKTKLGAISDVQGNFQIKISSTKDITLIVSCVGYQTKKISLKTDELSKEQVIALDEVPINTDEVIVSAGRRVQTVQEVPISVSIINKNDILERNSTQLDEALVYIPGVNKSGDHISIRGSSGFAFGLGSRVALLLDGFPLLSGDNGDMKFDAIPIFNIERVEVIKGAGSALYGTSALGGVINVISSDPEEGSQYRVNTYAGIYSPPRYDSWDYSDNMHSKYGVQAAFSGKYDDFGIMLSGTYRRDESYRLFDDSYHYSALSKISYKISEQSDISALFNFASNNNADWVYWNSLDSATRPPTNTDMDLRNNSDKISGMISFTHLFSDDHFMVLRTGLFGTDFANNLSRDNPEYRASQAWAFNNELQFNFNFSRHFYATYGACYVLNTTESKIYGNNDQSIISGYLQAENNSIEDLTVNAGMRWDYVDTEEWAESNRFSPKFGISYRLPYGIQLRSSFGYGFRAPTTAERFANIQYQGYDVLPNDNLVPETSRSIEIGGKFGILENDYAMSFDAALFMNDMYNLIEPTILEDEIGVIKFLNITRARIRGAEIEAKAFFRNLFSIETGLTLMEPLDLASDQVLKYRPELMFYGKLTIPLEFLELQTDYRYISKIVNIDEVLKLQIKDSDARVPIHVVDLRLIFDLHEFTEQPIKAGLLFNNLLDYYYTEFPGSLAPTRSIVLQLSAEY